MSGEWVLSADQRQAKSYSGILLRFEQTQKPSCSECYFRNRPEGALPCSPGAREDNLHGIWRQING